MPRRPLAITNTRVSSDEQLLSDSLERQEKSVQKAAEELGADIIKSWSGSVSSKKWSNLNRKDLEEMLQECKRNRQIKYAIFDELDRFMRSMLELAHFIVEFKKLGVQVVFASQPNLKTDTATDTLILMLEAFKAEGSNEERQRKSISGQTNALKDGRWTFHPKPGYKKGQVAGVPEIDEAHGLPLGAILNAIADGRLTLQQGLVDYNKVRVAVGKRPIKMDKFPKIVKDPFYAAIVEINKQVQVSNPEGRHDPLITIDTHHKLEKIVANKKKNQAGPRKNGNPKYPANNLITHDVCLQQGCGRLVGFDHGNGKNPNLVYEKYRCRTTGCGEYWTRQEIHEQMESLFNSNPITDDGLRDLTKALDIVWKQERGQAEQDRNRIVSKIKDLNATIERQVEAATDPSNITIKEKILVAISNKENEVSELEDQLEKLRKSMGSDKEQFLVFAFNFIQNMGSKFLEISQENRVKCKQIVFPAGFYVNAKKKVYTPEISPLYSLATKKKDTEVSEVSHLVQHS